MTPENEKPTLRAFFQLALLEQRGREGWGTRKGNCRFLVVPMNRIGTRSE
jgi:hypothetical protein